MLLLHLTSQLWRKILYLSDMVAVWKACWLFLFGSIESNAVVGISDHRPVPSVRGCSLKAFTSDHDAKTLKWSTIVVMLMFKTEAVSRGDPVPTCCCVIMARTDGLQMRLIVAAAVGSCCRYLLWLLLLLMAMLLRGCCWCSWVSSVTFINGIELIVISTPITLNELQLMLPDKRDKSKPTNSAPVYCSSVPEIFCKPMWVYHCYWPSC